MITMTNEQVLQNFFDTLSEVHAGGVFASDSDEWAIWEGVEERAYKFKLAMRAHATFTFVAYKRNDRYYLHSYNVKRFPLTRDEFNNYLNLLVCVGEITIVKTDVNGKKPK